MKKTTYQVLNKNGDVLQQFLNRREAEAFFAVHNPNHVTLRMHTEETVVLCTRKVNEKGNAIFE